MTGPALWLTISFMLLCGVMGYHNAKRERVGLTIFWMTGWAVASIHTVLS